MIGRSPPVLDLGPLTEAFGEIGEDASAMLGLFVETTGPLLEAVSQSLAEDDPHAAESHAHAAKGAANVTGAFRLGDLCGRIEKHLKSGEVPAARQLSDQLAIAFAEVVAVIGEQVMDGKR